MLLFARRVEDDAEHFQTLVAAADGRILAAYRSPYGTGRGCFMGTRALTSTRVIFMLNRATPEGDLRPPLLMMADLATPSDVRRVVDELEGPAFHQYIDANDAVIAAGTPGAVARVTYEGDVTWLSGRCNALQDDAIFAHRWAPDGRYELAVQDGRGERVLLAVAKTEVGALATDGHELAWYQGAPVGGGPWETSELWTSAYTTDPPVAGRRLFDADRRSSYPDFVVSEGHVIRTIAPDGGLEIISLADGSEVDRIPREDDDSFAVASHAYLRDGELGFGITRGNITPWNVTYRWVQR